MADPTLESFFGTTKTGENDNWGGASDLSGTFARLGAFPYAAANPRNAAVLATLPPGSYTVQVSGGSETSGLVIAEVYEVR